MRKVALLLAALSFASLLVFACVGDDPVGTPPGFDASTDSPVAQPDSPAGNDGGTPAAPTYCTLLPAPHSFCADFDGVPTVDTGWSQMFAVGGSELAFERLTFRSSPFAAHARTPASDAAVTTVAALRKTFTLGTERTMRVELDLYNPRSTPLPAPGRAGPFIIRYNGLYAIVLELDATGWVVTADDSDQKRGYRFTGLTFPDPIPKDRWTRLFFETSYVNGGALKVGVIGEDNVATTLIERTRVLTNLPTPAQTIAVEVGASVFTPSPALDFRFDNIVMDLKP